MGVSSWAFPDSNSGYSFSIQTGPGDFFIVCVTLGKLAPLWVPSFLICKPEMTPDFPYGIVLRAGWDHAWRCHSFSILTVGLHTCGLSLVSTVKSLTPGPAASRVGRQPLSSPSSVKQVCLAALGDRQWWLICEAAGHRRLQQLAELGRVGPSPIGTCSWASLAFTHDSQVDFKHAHGFLKDCFIFSDARANGFIDSSFHQGCMRWLLFSHWLSPTTISTFLAGVQGDLRGTKLIAFSKPSFRKAARFLLFALPGGGGQRSSLQSWGDGWPASSSLDSPVFRQSRWLRWWRTSPHWALAGGAVDWVWRNSPFTTSEWWPIGMCLRYIFFIL